MVDSVIKFAIVMSNILSVFNPPPSRELDEEETRDCVPCQVMSTVFGIGFGSYLVSGRAFKYSEAEKKKGISLEEFNKRNPMWWRRSLKGLGSIFIIMGLARGTEGWLWNKEKEYKKF